MWKTSWPHEAVDVTPLKHWDVSSLCVLVTSEEHEEKPTSSLSDNSSYKNTPETEAFKSHHFSFIQIRWYSTLTNSDQTSSPKRFLSCVFINLFSDVSLRRNENQTRVFSEMSNERDEKCWRSIIILTFDCRWDQSEFSLLASELL